MSRIASRFQTNKLTVWPVISESDGYSDAVYGTPFVVGCEYDQKPRVMRDDSGNEFVPEYTFYVTASLGQIERDWYVELGKFDEVNLDFNGAPLNFNGSQLTAISEFPTDRAKRVRAVRAQQNIGRLGGDDITVLV